MKLNRIGLGSYCNSFLSSLAVFVLPSGLQPGGISRYLILVRTEAFFLTSVLRLCHSWKITWRGLSGLCMGFVSPYIIGSVASSSWKVPNILSQIIRHMPIFLSRYLILLAWCTLWWLGLTNKISNQRGILFMYFVCTSIPYVWVMEYINTISRGWKPRTAIGIKYTNL